ncbi:MAG: BON domain-containing protein [Pseudomonadota bacterium]
MGGPTSYLARTNDGWLTAKAKTRLLAARDVPGQRVKVVTENGTLYLLGILPREQADAAVTAVRQVYGLQRIVKVFEYLDEPSLAHGSP